MKQKNFIMKQNKGNMKYKLKCLDDGKIYTVSELADKLCIEERYIRKYLDRKIYGKKYVKTKEV